MMKYRHMDFKAYYWILFGYLYFKGEAKKEWLFMEV
jgi:hypothetical protein